MCVRACVCVHACVRVRVCVCDINNYLHKCVCTYIHVHRAWCVYMQPVLVYLLNKKTVRDIVVFCFFV